MAEYSKSREDQLEKIDLTGLVQGRLGGIDLGKDVFAGDILVDHAVNGLNLADNLFQSAVQILSIHALLHMQNQYYSHL